ncbi:hypothetical protein M407DRAFT_25234, partial [Tulasnella calospora MUT 4182]
MMGQPAAVHPAVQFGWELGKELNSTAPGPEAKLIAPEPGQDFNQRYRVYVRRNGRSVHVLDSFAKRGLEILVDKDVTVKAVVERILRQQRHDFCRGNLNWDFLWPRISERLLTILMDPNAAMGLRSQTTVQFQVDRTKFQEYVAVTDLRNIPERRGDVRPQYIISLESLTGQYGIVSSVYWRSAMYDRVRAALYNSAPTATDRLRDNAHIRPWSSNRFTITMSSPHTWWIQDAYTQRNLYLWETLIADLSFDIGQWFIHESSVYDLSEEEFNNVQGSLWCLTNTDDFNSDLGSTSLFPQPMTDKIIGSTGGIEDYHLEDIIEPTCTSEEEEEGSESGELSMFYDASSEIRSRRSPRPYA